MKVSALASLAAVSYTHLALADEPPQAAAEHQDLEGGPATGIAGVMALRTAPVAYTHLDVYKRQVEVTSRPPSE